MREMKSKLPKSNYFKYLIAVGITLVIIIIFSSPNIVTLVEEIRDIEPTGGDPGVRLCLKKWGHGHEDKKSQLNIEKGTCPKTIPPDLYNEYTVNGTIAVVVEYKCQASTNDYSKNHTYTNQQISELMDRVKSRLTHYYGITDAFLYRALDKYPIINKSVVIMGSQRPFYESVCIVFGGTNCTTIDFQPIIEDHPLLFTMTIAEYDRNPINFDAAFSISSFEHDGLGRYGDPLRPDGDLTMMKKMKCIVKPDGILYLSVPMAKDKIIWNMHRVYGKIRLPLLIEDWTLLEVVSDSEIIHRWSGCDGNEADYEPVLVLQNRAPKEGHNLSILNKYHVEGEKGKKCRVWYL